MNDTPWRIRLALLGGALALFLAALVLMLSRWNQAELDRAFVEAAAAALREEAAPERPPLLWMPGPGAQPRRLPPPAARGGGGATW